MPKLRALQWIKARLPLLKELLLSNDVRPYVWIYYIPLLIWGFYATFFAAPVSYVQPAMGAEVYDAWAWMHIPGTVIVMCGLVLEILARKRDKDDPARDVLGNTAIRLQTGGHGCMFMVLLAYELSAIYGTAWGEATYGIFAISPYVLGCLLLLMQGITKLCMHQWDFQ